MGDRIKGITIEINGDTTGLSKAMSGINKEIKGTQGQLKDVERLLKLDPQNTELLAQKQRLLKEAVGETKEKLDSLKSAQQQVQEQFERGEVAKEQYDALQREIIETENNLKSLEKQADDTNTKLSGFTQAAEKIGKFGDAATSAGKKLLPVTAGITAAGGASAKMAMDFEDAMAKVNTIADTTEAPLSELEKSILDLSNQTGISSSEIASNVYDAISAGQETGDAVDFVTNSTKLARAGFADAGSALDVLTTIMNAYGLEASEVSRVSDVLIQTQNLGKTTVGELSSSMGKIIPTAKANGVALEQVAAGYAMMTANGVATAESTTYMNSMFNELGKSGTKVSNTLKEKTGKSFLELMQEGASLSEVLQVISDSAAEQGLAFGDLWGSAEAGKAGLILLGESAETFNGTLEQMRNSTGATETAFEKLNTNSYTIQKALNQLKNTAIELGSAVMDVLAPIIISLADKIQEFTSWFSGLPEGTKKMIVLIAMVTAALGPFLLIIGKMSTGLSGIIGAFGKASSLAGTFGSTMSLLTGPVGLVVAAIAALIAIIAVLYNKNEDFRAKTNEIWSKIQEIISSATEKIGNILTAFSELALLIWQKWGDDISFCVESNLDFVMTLVDNALSAIEGIIKLFSSILSGDWEGAWNALVQIFRSIGAIIIAAVKNTFNMTIAGIRAILKFLPETVQNGFDGAIVFLKSLPSKALEWGADFIDGLIDGIKSRVAGVVDAVKGLGEKISSYLHFSRPDTGPLRNYESWMPDFMDGLAKGVKDNSWKVEKQVNLLASGMAEQGTNADFSGVESRLSSIADAFRGLSLQVVLDDGTLVGKILPKIDDGLQESYASKIRG